MEAGLTPMQAIQAATINVARAFRKDQDFGTVEPGKVADLIAVEGDPLKDMWAVQNVKVVVLNGEVVDSDFHADYKNPIPNIRPWRATPREAASRSSSPRPIGCEAHGLQLNACRHGAPVLGTRSVPALAGLALRPASVPKAAR